MSNPLIDRPREEASDMTLKELIELLQTFAADDPDLPVFFQTEDGPYPVAKTDVYVEDYGNGYKRLILDAE